MKIYQEKYTILDGNTCAFSSCIPLQSSVEPDLFLTPPTMERGDLENARNQHLNGYNPPALNGL